MEFTKEERKGLMLINFFTGECKGTVHNKEDFVQHEEHFFAQWNLFVQKAKKNKKKLVFDMLEQLFFLFPSQSDKSAAAPVVVE